MIHTPYDGSAKPFSIGLKPLDAAEWIDADENLDLYLIEKHRLYAEETANVLVAEAGTEEAQAEVLAMLVDYLPTRFPDIYGGGKLSHRFCDDGGLSDLARAALLVQEDLVLMRKSQNGWRLVAASLCFPSAWNLRKKFGKALHDVHGPVPGFSEGTRNASLIERMFDNLKPEQPVLRWNWSLYGEAKLHFPTPIHGATRRFGDGTDISGRVTIRLERQTLRKLPKSGDILFTIRIYLDPLEVLETVSDGGIMALAIDAQLDAFTVEEIDYKGLSSERPRLSARLRQIAALHNGGR